MFLIFNLIIINIQEIKTEVILIIILILAKMKKKYIITKIPTLFFRNIIFFDFITSNLIFNNLFLKINNKNNFILKKTEKNNI